MTRLRFGVLAAIPLLALVAIPVSRPHAATAAIEVPFETSWLGNSLNGINRNHVQQNCFAAWVGPDGRVICNAPWDEGTKNGGVYWNGLQVGALAGFHDHGGFAITADSQYVYAGGFDNGNNGIWRNSLSDYYAASFNGGSGELGNFRVVQSQGSSGLEDLTGKPRGMAVQNGNLYVSITSANRVEVYRTSDMVYVRSFSVSAPTRIAADSSGRLWIATRGKVVAFSTSGSVLGPQITDTDDPTALAIDNHGRLLVGDDGATRQQVRIYDISSSPSLVETVGVAGGMFASPAGQVGPLRFNGIVGVGTDFNGNLYVAQDHPTSQIAGTGTNIEAYGRSGSSWTRNWQLLGLGFVDLADADVTSYSGGVFDAYTADEHFKVDLSKPAGQQWTWVGDLRNRFAYPSDPRVAGDDQDHGNTMPRLVTLAGTKFLVTEGMNGGVMRFYKFVAGTENTALSHTEDVCCPAASTVDSNGDIWIAHNDVAFTRRSFAGLTRNGDPTYESDTNFDLPAPFNYVGHVNYDAATDALFVAGFTPANPAWPNKDKVMGSTLARYDNWSQGNRKAAWTTVLPYNTNGNVGSANGIGMITMDIVADRIYTVMLNPQNNEKAPRIYSYDQSNGQQLAWWLPGATTGECGWVDALTGLNARKLPNGQTVIFQEEDFQAKVLMWVSPRPLVGH